MTDTSEETIGLLSGTEGGSKDFTEIFTLQRMSSDSSDSDEQDQPKLNLETNSTIDTQVSAGDDNKTEDTQPDDNTDNDILNCLNAEPEEKDSDTNEVNIVENETNNVDIPDDDENTFRVIINSTKASDSLGLSGNYKLITSQKELELGDLNSDKVLYRWPYRFIRRFGCSSARNSFLIDAGKKCESGEGIFDFQILGNLENIIMAIRDKDGCSLKRSNETGMCSTDG